MCEIKRENIKHASKLFKYVKDVAQDTNKKKMSIISLKPYVSIISLKPYVSYLFTGGVKRLQKNAHTFTI